jgi:hypothetical protein
MNFGCVVASSGARYLQRRSQRREKAMFRTFMISAASTAVVAFSPIMFAQQGNSHGTPEEAKAMLMKAVAAVKTDKSKAIDMFNKGDGGFLDRDLYVFCANVDDGKIVAQGNPNAKQILGQDQRTLKDASGRNFGAELYAAGKKPEGQITEVSYIFVRPGSDSKNQWAKVSLVTRVSDLVCGVGYYK